MSDGTRPHDCKTHELESMKRTSSVSVSLCVYVSSMNVSPCGPSHGRQAACTPSGHATLGLAPVAARNSILSEPHQNFCLRPRLHVNNRHLRWNHKTAAELSTEPPRRRGGPKPLSSSILKNVENSHWLELKWLAVVATFGYCSHVTPHQKFARPQDLTSPFLLFPLPQSTFD